MRTKQELISQYLNGGNSADVNVNLNSEIVEDLMNLWAEEVIDFIVIKAEFADMVDVLAELKSKMYPSAKIV
jgi:hypothetical protein